MLLPCVSWQQCYKGALGALIQSQHLLLQLCALWHEGSGKWHWWDVWTWKPSVNSSGCQPGLSSPCITSQVWGSLVTHCQTDGISNSAPFLGPGWGCFCMETFCATPQSCSPFSSCHPSHVQGFQNAEAETIESAAAVPANAFLKRLYPAPNRANASPWVLCGASGNFCACHSW